MINYTRITQTNLSQKKSLLQIIEDSKVPPELKQRLLQMGNRIKILSDKTDIGVLDDMHRYINFVVSLPWTDSFEEKYDIAYAQQVLNKNHYGLASVKNRIYEYLSILQLQKSKKRFFVTPPILLFVGLAGTGKTSIAYSIAQALDRHIGRIPFGGLSSSIDLRGVSRLHQSADPGLILKTITATKGNNPVLLLDELDRLNSSGRSGVMGVLLELLDPAQNSHFLDHYIDYPFDLSKIFYIATANNTNTIPSAVLDRLEIIQMPAYSEEEKFTIAKKYIYVKKIQNSGLDDIDIKIHDDVWVHILKTSSYDPGLRSIERKIDCILRKIAYQVVMKKIKSYSITKENIASYLEE